MRARRLPEGRFPAGRKIGVQVRTRCRPPASGRRRSEGELVRPATASRCVPAATLSPVGTGLA